MSNRDVVEAYARVFAHGKPSEQDQFLHPEIVEEYPQSGERFVGIEQRRGMLEGWPKEQYPTRASMDTIVGGGDQVILMPTYRTLRVSGTGDDFTTCGTVTYPNGETWFLVQLLHMKDGKIAHMTSYFAPPFEAPEWRAPFREAP